VTPDGDELGHVTAVSNLPHDATGLAAGTSVRNARVAGAAEVLERHHLIGIWQISGYPTEQMPQRVVTCERDLAPYLRVSADLGLVANFYTLGIVDRSFTVLCTLADRSGGAVTCGSATRPHASSAMRKAISEALGLQWTMRNGHSAVHVASLDKPASTLERVTAAYTGRIDVLGWIAAQQARTARLPHPRSAPQLGFFAYDAAIEEVQIAGWSVAQVMSPNAFARQSPNEEREQWLRRLKHQAASFGFTVDQVRPHTQPFG
jgi:ribosomal protein S12 methylthiotransferase accessory factor YcaO-like protein